MRFEAAIHGMDLDKDAKGKPKESISFMKFGDPEEYKKLSKKEREELTQKMMAKHQNTMRQQKHGG